MCAVLCVHIESGRKSHFVFRRNCGNAYDLGWKRNLQEIFGTNPLICFLPIASRYVCNKFVIIFAKQFTFYIITC